MTYRYWELEIDGPDKTGKNLLCEYLCEMSKYRFSINVRGILSQMVYTKKFNRKFEYDTTNFSKNKILILLTADKHDIVIRCKHTKEEYYNVERDHALFEEAALELAKQRCCILTYNTSHMTPYDIAKDVIETIDLLEERT